MTDMDRRIRESDERRAAAKPRFDKWIGFLNLAGYGFDTYVFRRVKEAVYDVRAWREASQTRGGDYEVETLVIRVAADTFASQIEAAALPEHDRHTVAWVVAGLRCPARPFCSGCPSCFTATSPTRKEARNAG